MPTRWKIEATLKFAMQNVILNGGGSQEEGGRQNIQSL